MTDTIPPCPVCGTVPQFDSASPSLLWASCNCITAPDLYEPWKWDHACMRELGWKLAEHGIHTLAQLAGRMAATKSADDHIDFLQDFIRTLPYVHEDQLPDDIDYVYWLKTSYILGGNVGVRVGPVAAAFRKSDGTSLLAPDPRMTVLEKKLSKALDKLAMVEQESDQRLSAIIGYSDQLLAMKEKYEPEAQGVN